MRRLHRLKLAAGIAAFTAGPALFIGSAFPVAPAFVSSIALAQTPPAPDHQAGDHAISETPYKRTPSPPDAYVYIGWPNNNEVLHTTHIRVWFGTRNFGVAPAGTSKPNTGHHHLLIDTVLPPLDQPIPNDKNHLHFGLGQTETFIDLPPGTHTLQLLMADGEHVPHDPPLMSKKITIYVRPSGNPIATTQ